MKLKVRDTFFPYYWGLLHLYWPEPPLLCRIPFLLRIIISSACKLFLAQRNASEKPNSGVSSFLFYSTDIFLKCSASNKHELLWGSFGKTVDVNCRECSSMLLLGHRDMVSHLGNVSRVFKSSRRPASLQLTPQSATFHQPCIGNFLQLFRVSTKLTC